MAIRRCANGAGLPVTAADALIRLRRIIVMVLVRVSARGVVRQAPGADVRSARHTITNGDPDSVRWHNA